MFGLFKKKDIDLKDFLRQTRHLKIKGIAFAIKKIDIEDHLSGLNVLLNIHQLYTVGSKKEPSEQLADLKTVRKFMRDIIFAGVVSPVLNITKEQNENIHVDEILNDMQLAQELTSAIINFSYGKKK